MRAKRIIPVLVILALVAGGGWWYFTRTATGQSSALAASGTIEATQIIVSPEVGGRVTAVNFKEGDPVHAGDVLVVFDPSLLQAQRKQAAAALAAAQANFAGLQSGTTHQQLQASVAQAQMQLLAAQQALADLNNQAALAAAQANQAVAAAQLALTKAKADLLKVSQGVPDADTLALAQANETLAEAALANAKQHADNLASGPDRAVVALAQARQAAAQAALQAAQAALAPEQLAAAQAQVDTAQAAVGLLDAQLGKLMVLAPADGVILTQAIETGEVASPGATLMVLGRLTELRATVYVPEDRYGQIKLGQTANLSVDSFPGRVFVGKVSQIADQAAFTPRNTQTVEGRKNTVFAVRLSIANPDLVLKPGMPADVTFQQ